METLKGAALLALIVVAVAIILILMVEVTIWNPVIGGLVDFVVVVIVIIIALAD